MSNSHAAGQVEEGRSSLPSSPTDRIAPPLQVPELAPATSHTQLSFQHLPQEPPSPADLGLSPPTSGLEAGNNVQMGAGSGGDGGLHSRRPNTSHARDYRHGAVTAVSPATNFVPAYGPSPNVRTRDYPAGGGAHRGHAHHHHTHSSGSASSAHRRRTSSAGSTASTSSATAHQGNSGRKVGDNDPLTASNDGVFMSSSSPQSQPSQQTSLPRVSSRGNVAKPTQPFTEPPPPPGLSGGAHDDGDGDDDSSSDDGAGWVRTSLGTSGSATAAPTTAGDAEAHHEHPLHGSTHRLSTSEDAAAHELRDRRLTTTSPGFGFGLLSTGPIFGATEDPAEGEAQTMSEATHGSQVIAGEGAAAHPSSATAAGSWGYGHFNDHNGSGSRFNGGSGSAGFLAQRFGSAVAAVAATGEASEGAASLRDTDSPTAENSRTAIMQSDADPTHPAAPPTAASLPAFPAVGQRAAALSPAGAEAGAMKPRKTVSWLPQPASSEAQGPSSPPPTSGISYDFSRVGRSLSNASFALNASFGLNASLANFSFSNFSFLKDPLAASVVMQQNRTALISELERRRGKLKKQLAQLQREATARNIFALVRSSNASQLQYLLQEKLCNVNEQDYNGCTPLHVAAGEGNQAIVSVLLSFGADVLAVDHLGRTPLDCAAANRHSGVGRYLLAAIRGRVQREGSASFDSLSAGLLSVSGGGANSQGAPSPMSADRGLWPPRILSTTGGSSPAASVSPPASLDTTRPATMVVSTTEGTSPMKAVTPGQGGASAAAGQPKVSLLAPGNLQHPRRQSNSSYHEGDVSPLSSHPSHSRGLGPYSSSGSLPVVATPLYLGGTAGGNGMPSSYGSGSLHHATSPSSEDVTRDPTATSTPAAAAAAAAADTSAKPASGVAVPSVSVVPPPPPTTTTSAMLRPVRPPPDGAAGGQDLLSPTKGLRTSTGSVGEGSRTGMEASGSGFSMPNVFGSVGTMHPPPSGTDASSFGDMGMQTLDEYRHDPSLVRSGWGHPRTVVKSSTEAPLVLAPAPSGSVEGDHTTPGRSEGHMSIGSASSTSRATDTARSGASLMTTSATTTPGAVTAVDSHSSYTSGGGGRRAILHPWCTMCGQAHPSYAPCMGASIYGGSADAFVQHSLLANQRILGSADKAGGAGDGSLPVAEEKATLSTPTMADPCGAATATVTTVDAQAAPMVPRDVHLGKSEAAPKPPVPTEAVVDADEADLNYSSYTTVSDTVSLVVCMCGLPGRGKSFISKRLVRYMNWKGVPCKVFNAGNYRRQLLGVEGTANAEFFNPDNPKGKELRERMAELACEDLVRFLCDHPLAIGILDATNTTKARRKRLRDFFAQEAQKHDLPYRLLFIESVCTDETIITENILRSKCDNDDFKTVKDTNEVIAEFRDRIQQYERVYETLEPDEGLSFIKIINIKHHVVIHKVHTGLGSRIAFFLMNLHPVAYPIYLALPGETVGDAAHVYGGDEKLTAAGEAYAVALKHFIQDRYVPNMIVLHATNRCVISTLQPLIADDEGAFGTGAYAGPVPASGTGSRGESPATLPVNESESGSSTVKRVSPTSRRAVGNSAPGASNSNSNSSVGGGNPAVTEPALFVHGHHKNKHVVSPTSALEQPLRPVTVQAATAEELARVRRMAGGDLQDIPIAGITGSSDAPGVAGAATAAAAAAEEGKDSVDTRDDAEAGEGASKLVSPVTDGTQHDDDDVDDEEDYADEVLVPVPGLDNLNFGRFSGHTAKWVQQKYPRLSSLLYVNVDDSAAAAAAAAGVKSQRQPTDVDAGVVGGEDGAAPPTRKMQDREASTPMPEDDPRRETGKGNEALSSTGTTKPTTPTTVAEILARPPPPPTHFAKKADAITCFTHVPSPTDPRLSYCVQFPNGESCRQVNVRLEPALMAVMRTQSPVFVVAPRVPAEGMLAFFSDVIPELSPTLRMPQHCVVEMGLKDDVTVHRLLSTAGDHVVPPGPSSPVLDQMEIEETLKLATSMRMGVHPFAASSSHDGSS